MIRKRSQPTPEPSTGQRSLEPDFDYTRPKPSPPDSSPKVLILERSLPRRIRFCSVRCLLLVVIGGSPALAEEASNAHILLKLKHVERELAQLRESVELLRKESEATSEFPPIKLRVVSPAGKPLSGFRIRLWSKPEGREIEVSGTSDEAGLAMDRILPYGNYRLSVHHDSGWRVFSKKVLVEFGVGLDQTIIAPDPGPSGTVRLSSRLSASGLRGFGFGRPAERRGVSWRYGYAPEPDDPSDRHRTLPTIGDGIDTIAVRAKLFVERELEQPDGKMMEWVWWSPEPDLLVTSGSLVQSLDWDWEHDRHRPRAEADYFSGLDDDEFVSVVSRPAPTSAEPTTNEVVLDAGTVERSVPAGEVSLSLRDLIGFAKEEALEALDYERDDRHLVWLQTSSVKADSAWPRRFIDFANWEPGKRTLATRDFQVNAGERVEIAIESPSEE